MYTQNHTKHYDLFPINYSFTHIYDIFIITYILIDKLNQINLIKNACVRKAKPQRAVQPAIGACMHAGGSRTGVGAGKLRRWRDIPVGLAGWYGSGSRGSNAYGGGAGVGTTAGIGW
jgi:hypothetical protein